MEKTSAVIIAKCKQPPATSQNRVEEVGHGLQPGAICIGGLSQDLMEQEHVQRVNVVIARLLEMASVGVNLTADLCLHHLVPGLFPAACMRETRKENAQGMECDGFSQQVSVRGKIKRK